jgi:hypothetical protein
MLRRDLTIVFVAAAAACFAYGRDGQPIFADRGYHVYMAQSVLRGDPLYGGTTYGYTPYAPLLTSLAMRVTAPFGVPSYLAPRYLGVALMLLMAVLLYFVARRASDSRTALIAALTLCGFANLGLLSVVGTEPVVVVGVFTLLAILAIQREWWFLAGFAACAAAMSWQPAVVVCVATFIIARRRLAVIAGGCAAAVPAIVYVLATRSVDAFLYQTILRKFASAGAGPGVSWLLLAMRSYWTDAAVLLCGAIGFAVALRRRRSEEVPLIAITLAWSVWGTIYFAAARDFIPALSLVAYWAARIVAPRSKPALVLYLAILFGDAAMYRSTYSLSDQIRDVRDALGAARSSFVAFNAEEFYILTETRAPVRYIRLAAWTDDFIEARDAGGIAAFQETIAHLNPAAIIICDDEGPSRSRAALDPLLRHRERRVMQTPYSFQVESPYLPTLMSPTIIYRRH